MNELIRVNYDAEQPMVSARELYQGLGIRTAFKDWFPRICGYGFEEGKDFCSFLSESTGGRPAKDYEITVDMAKQICMLQKSEKGMLYRRYFLELEKRWNSPEQVMARALQLARAKTEQLKMECHALSVMVADQQRQIAALEPKAKYLDEILHSDRSLVVTQIAKDYGMSAQAFNKYLHELGIQFKAHGQWVLYAAYQKNGYVCSTTFEIMRKNGVRDFKTQTEWTQRGRMFLYQTLQAEGVLPLIERG